MSSGQRPYAAQPGQPAPGAAAVPMSVPAPAGAARSQQSSEANTERQAEGRASQVAAAAAKAAPLAAPLAAPGFPPQGAPPAHGATPPRPTTPPQWHARRHRSLPRLRLGRHTTPIEALDQLSVRRSGFGLQLGRGRSGEPVVLRLFRPQPTTALLLGGAWAAELLCYRALRCGARAVVFSEAAASWVELGRRATGRTDRVAVRVPGDEVATAGSADVPVLRLDRTGEPAGPELPGWTTRLSVVEPGMLGQYAAGSGGTGQRGRWDLVLTQRLAPQEIAVLAHLLELPPPTQEALAALPDAVLAVLTGSGVHYAWVDLSPVEREVLGALPRH